MGGVHTPVTGLTLALLVLGVLADNHNAALALDDLALFAHGLHGRSNFHLYFLLLASPHDTAAGDVIGRHLYGDLIAGKDPDKVHPELAGNMRQNDVAFADIYLEHGVGQGFYYRALEFDYIVFCQSKFLQSRLTDPSNILCHSENLRFAVGYCDGVFIVS